MKRNFATIPCKGHLLRQTSGCKTSPMEEWEIEIYKGKPRLLTLEVSMTSWKLLTKNSNKDSFKRFVKFQIINFKLQILLKTALRAQRHLGFLKIVILEKISFLLWNFFFFRNGIQYCRGSKLKFKGSFKKQLGKYWK